MIKGGREGERREGKGGVREGRRERGEERERVGSLPPAAAKCIGRFPLPSAI